MEEVRNNKLSLIRSWRQRQVAIELKFCFLSSVTKVAVRVRPILDTNDVACIQVTPNGAILFDEGGASRNKLKRYVYDHVFDDSSSQEVVYQKTTAALVKDVLNGFSAAVFAYGATGSG